MSGREMRLARLESAISSSRADRGSYCRDCGGMTIDEALSLSDDEASEWEEVAMVCRRCGRITLFGVLAELIAE